jgi:pre-rRNA-processing protein RIX1
MSLPLSVILKELEDAPSSIIEIVSSLRNDKTILQEISKVQRKHLVSRTLALSKSPKEYNKWCGTVIIRAIGNDYEVLANEGVNILGQLIKNLENYNGTINVKILLTTIDAINYVCQNIRGKPTLTREILTPKLSTIISLYIEKLQYNPLLIIKSLTNILRNHPTTFRPFGNKLVSYLSGLMNFTEFCSFPRELQNAIFETLAALPAIEKNDPEATWENNVNDIIKQIKSVAIIYQEFLNFTDDQELVDMLKKLPELNDSVRIIFPNLSIDINEPITIYEISTRIEILLSLLSSYITNETQFTVKIPLGIVLLTIQMLCSINTRFLSFKYDIRDELVKNVISSSILRNQHNSVKFINQLVHTYKGNLLPHINSILETLEVMIPFKNKRVEYQDLICNEGFYCDILSCVNVCLSLTRNWSDTSILLRFIDISLFLVEPRIDNLQNSSNLQQQPQQPQAGNGNKKLKKKKNVSSVPLSDLLSHQHLFVNSIDSNTIKVVRQFLNRIITVVSLPLTYHYKIMRFIIIEAVTAKYYNNEHKLPIELKKLLINSIIYPGFEKISILPIVSSILGDDALLSVFNNPRFPPLPMYIKRATIDKLDSQDPDEEMEQEPSETETESNELQTEVGNIESREVNVQNNETPATESNEVVEDSSAKRRKLEDFSNKQEIMEQANVNIMSTMTPMKSIAEITSETIEFTNIPQKLILEAENFAPKPMEKSQDDDESDLDVPELNIEDSDEE